MPVAMRMHAVFWLVAAAGVVSFAALGLWSALHSPLGHGGPGAAVDHVLDQLALPLLPVEWAEVIRRAGGRPLLPYSGAYASLPLASAPSTLDFVTVGRSVDFDRFASSVATFCEHFDFEALGRWLVVVPDDDEAFASAHLPRCRRSARGLPPSGAIPFVVVTESTIVPEFKPDRQRTAPYPLPGYIKQMLLKLAVAQLVPDAFYLVLDTDVYAHSPFSVSDLFVLGRDAVGKPVVRARIDLEHPQYDMPDQFFENSALVLGVQDLHTATRAVCAATYYEPSRSQSKVSLPWQLLFTTPRNNRLTTRSLDLERPLGLLMFDLNGTVGAPMGSGQPPAHANAFTMYGTCRGNRGVQIGYTPMLLHSAIINAVAIPAIRAQHSGCQEGRLTWSEALAEQHWVLSLGLWYVRLARLLGISTDRKLSWTEYGVYFYACTASGLFDDLYAVYQSGETLAGTADSAGDVRFESGLLDYDRCIQSHAEYKHADWKAIFKPALDSRRPFLLIHSWMGYPIEEINRHIAPHVQEMDALVKDCQPE